MNRLRIKIKDDSKMPLILSLLRELPFVEIEEDVGSTREGTARQSKGSVEDLFGIWAQRDVNSNEIRRKAWNRHKHDID